MILCRALSYEENTLDKSLLKKQSNHLFHFAIPPLFFFRISGSAAAKRQLDKEQKCADKQHDRKSQQCQQYNAHSTHGEPSFPDFV